MEVTTEQANINLIPILSVIGLLLGTWFTAKWKFKGDTQSANENSASAVLGDVFTRLRLVETEVNRLSTTLLKLQWRYLAALDDLKEHREVWPEDFLAHRPNVNPLIASDL